MENSWKITRLVRKTHRINGFLALASENLIRVHHIWLSEILSVMFSESCTNDLCRKVTQCSLEWRFSKSYLKTKVSSWHLHQELPVWAIIRAQMLSGPHPYLSFKSKQLTSTITLLRAMLSIKRHLNISILSLC